MAEMMGMKWLRVLARIFDRATNIAAFIAAALIMFIMIAVSTDVAMRYLFNRPMIWTVDVTRIMLLYITFLGTTWVLKRGGHIKVDILFSRLSPRNQSVVGILSSVIGIILCLVFVWYGTQVTWDYFQRGVRLYTELQPLRAPILAVVPVGSFLLLTQFLRNLYGHLGDWRQSINEQ